MKAFKHNVKIVSGSTGWMTDHKSEVEALTKDGKQTLFWASNFSIGVAIFSAVNRRYLTKIMNNFHSMMLKWRKLITFISWMLHQEPTITLAEELIDNIDRKAEWVKGFQHNADGTEEGSNEVADNQLAIASIRRDEVPGIPLNKL